MSGGTPLFDAIARTIESAEAAATPDEDQLVVIISDGYENASTEYDAAAIARLIAAREARGWTFVYLCSEPTVYSDGARFGAREGNTSRFDADSAGMLRAWKSVDRATRDYRGKSRYERGRDGDQWFDGRRVGEESP